MKRIVSIITALFMLLGLFAIDIPTSAEDAWVTIYANYIGSSNFDTENTESLLLADLNVDGTPELLRMRMGGGMGETVMQPMTVSGSSAMTCSGSNAVYLGYLIQKISINLYRKDSHFVWIIVVDCPTDSIGSDFIHKVFEISMSGKTVKSVGRFELRGTQSGGRIYYRDGKKVSKSTYNSSYTSYFKKLKSLNMSAIQGDTSAWHKVSSTRISAFNAMVSRYRSALQSAIPVTNVSLNKTKISLALEKSYTLKALVSPSFALNKAITWRSDNTSVAMVSGGTVKAVGYGTAKITATATSGKYGTCTVTVPRPSATKVTIITSSSEVYTGSSLQLTASVSPSAASQSVTWTSSNRSVASVDSKGLVKGQKPGTATITAMTSNGKKAAKTLRVKLVEVTGVSLGLATVSVEAGKTRQLSATVQPTNATDKTLTWISSDTSVATVSSAGLVTAKKAGSATITAKAKNGVNGTCNVTVMTPPETIQWDNNWSSTRKLEELRKLMPDGYYWNAGVTVTPSTPLAYLRNTVTTRSADTYNTWQGSYTPRDKGHGFSRLLGWFLTGVEIDDARWTSMTFDTLQTGDYVRYSYNGSIIAAIVVSKSSDTLQLVECNNGHPQYYSSGNDSIINWQATRTRSFLSSCSWVNYWGYRASLPAEAEWDKSWSFDKKIAALRKILPDKKYWRGGKALSTSSTLQDIKNSVSDTGCPSMHSYSTSTCNRWVSGTGGGQCHGFAKLVGYLLTNSDVSSSAWKYITFSDLIPGDFIRDKTSPHSMIVLTRNGNSLTVVECNYPHPEVSNSRRTCIIRWDRTVTKDSFQGLSMEYYGYRP